MKNFIITLVVLIIAGVGIYLLAKSSSKVDLTNNQNVSTTTPSGQIATSTVNQKNPDETIIGKSVQGRDITAYHYGTGSTELLFVGGIHGGYEWNTVLLAYQTMDYLKQNLNLIPSNIKVTIIPVLNPDGLNKIVGTAGRFTTANVPSPISATVAGRFNANNVDLSRNFDCNWQVTGTWQNKTVSGGSKVFSEPESLAMKNYVETSKPIAIVTWYSAAGGIYASSCNNGVSAETNTITKKYADASGYPAYDSFDFYETTGDMVNWFAKINIPAISVLLTNHTDVEWTKNLAGIQALLKYYTK
ncbi:MAG: M14 family zinc carboxypeptidase [Candidatus Zambryskibacteria bacterium]|nr:M14 family zinc carboxypeptidase [Candidatus Zambryskibacteria bacterium]